MVGLGGGGFHRKKKNGLKGGHLKKKKEKGGSRKILPLLEGGRGKKCSYWGESCNFLMTLQKIPPAPPTSLKMNGPLAYG